MIPFGFNLNSNLIDKTAFKLSHLRQEISFRQRKVILLLLNLFIGLEFLMNFEFI